MNKHLKLKLFLAISFATTIGELSAAENLTPQQAAQYQQDQVNSMKKSLPQLQQNFNQAINQLQQVCSIKNNSNLSLCKESTAFIKAMQTNLSTAVNQFNNSPVAVTEPGAVNSYAIQTFYYISSLPLVISIYLNCIMVEAGLNPGNWGRFA